MGSYVNADGLRVDTPPRVKEALRGGVTNNAGPFREHVVEFSYDSLPSGSTDLSYTAIPANAILVDAYFEVLTAFAGGTSYDIDLVDSADAAIGTGTDKLWDALALADINAVGERSVSSTHGGTNSGNALNVALASAGMLNVIATGTFTAGRARIVIRYLPAPGA